MKNKISLLLILFASANFLFAQQSRNGISYQALILDTNVEELPGVNNVQSPLANTQICLAFTILDSLGNDRFPGRAALIDYEIRGDSLFDKIILRDDRKLTDYERARKIDISGDVLKIFNLNAEGNGRIVHFNRQSQ